MAATVRTRAYLETAISPNGVNAITGQQLQDFVASVLFDMGTYSGATTYVINDIVEYGGSLWRSLSNQNLANTPVAGANWELMVAGSTGTPSIVANANVTAQSAAVTSLATYTATGLGSYRVGGYVAITAVTLDVLQFRVGWTDENSNAQSVTLIPAGAGSANLAAVGFFAFSPVDIRAKSGTAITSSVALTTATGSVAFDAGSTIMFLS